MDLGTVMPRLRQRWWVVAAAVALALLGAALTLDSSSDRHERTIHLVLRPDSSVSGSNLPGALEVLKSDGGLVQTVLGALSSGEMVRRAAVVARVRLAPGYAITSSARPGSALIDSTVAGPDAAVVDRLAGGFARVAADYVATSYSAYALDSIGTDPGGQDTRLSPTQVMVLALLLGGALGVGVVLLELRLDSRARPMPAPHGAPAPWTRPAPRHEREPIARVGTVRDGPPTPVWVADDGRCRATTSKGSPCRNRRLDDSDYCRLHRARFEAEHADLSWENGASADRTWENGVPAVFRPAGPARRPPDGPPRPDDRPRPPDGPEEDR
jgi:hypothetical protein